MTNFKFLGASIRFNKITRRIIIFYRKPPDFYSGIEVLSPKSFRRWLSVCAYKKEAVGLYPRSLALIFVCVIANGCGLVPGGGRFFSDYHKTSHYAVSGASKIRVKMDWGKPDEIAASDEKETWIYYNRQDGKTFKFIFDNKGKLVLTNIE